VWDGSGENTLRPGEVIVQPSGEKKTQGRVRRRKCVYLPQGGLGTPSRTEGGKRKKE